MFVDNSFNMINLAEDVLEIGFKQTLRAAAEGRAAKVFLAEDCEDKIRIPVKEACENGKAELVKVPTMRLLGKMCGIDVKASCAAVLRK